MKLIVAFIKPFKLEEVKDALAELRIDGMTVTETKRFPAPAERGAVFQDSKRAIHFIPILKIEVALPDHLAALAIDIIVKSAATEKNCDGRVFLLSLDDVVRIRTDERGAVAF